MLIETPTNTVTITANEVNADVNAEWEKWINDLDENTIEELSMILK